MDFSLKIHASTLQFSSWKGTLSLKTRRRWVKFQRRWKTFLSTVRASLSFSVLLSTGSRKIKIYLWWISNWKTSWECLKISSDHIYFFFSQYFTGLKLIYKIVENGLLLYSEPQGFGGKWRKPHWFESKNRSNQLSFDLKRTRYSLELLQEMSTLKRKPTWMQ